MFVACLLTYFTFDLKSSFCCFRSAAVRRLLGFRTFFAGDVIDAVFFSDAMDDVLVNDSFLEIDNDFFLDNGVVVSMATGADDPPSRRVPNNASTSLWTPFLASRARTSFSYTCMNGISEN